jgi:4-hydroxy-3-methylbut-2-enyl diphosphate reductase
MDLVRSGKKPIYTLGPIIHNNTVTEKLEAFGVRSVKDLDEIEPGSYVLVRSHGITPKLRQELVQRGLNICDATCPKVARVQAIIKSHVNQGYLTVIIGDHGHAETQGLLGYSDDKGVVLSTMQEIERFIKGAAKDTRICVVAQTTQEPQVFQDLCKELGNHFKDIKIIDTICDATRKRQIEINKKASCYDCVIVAGGKNSANTTRLYETALKSGKKAFHIENSRELDEIDLKDCNSVLVTAGASTPFWIIHEVKENIRKSNLMENVLSLLASKWFGTLSFALAFIYSLFFLSRADRWVTLIGFAASLMLVLGLTSMYMSRLDMFEKKLPYAELAIAGGFLTLGVISLFFRGWLTVALLYYGLLFYVVYKNKAVARRIVIATLNLSFWIIAGGIGYGK